MEKNPIQNNQRNLKWNEVEAEVDFLDVYLV